MNVPSTLSGRPVTGQRPVSARHKPQEKAIQALVDSMPIAPGDTRPVLAIDIGGTKLAAAAVDRTGRILHSTRVPTPDVPPGGGDLLWRKIVSLIGDMATEAGVGFGGGFSGIGVSCGGPMEWPAGTVSPVTIPAWRDFPLRDRLRKLYPGLPVRVHSDAVCTAVGEHWRGAGRGRRDVLGMVVGSCVTGGLICDGRLVDGHSGNAGSIGHVVVEPDGPRCTCGGNGCLDAIARGPRVTEWAREHGWSAGPSAGTRHLTEDAIAGDRAAVAALQRAGSALGVAIASVSVFCDLQTVAISGGLAQAGPLLFDPLEEAFHAHARVDTSADVAVVPAALGQDAGLVGAAGLLFGGDRYWHGD